MALLTIAVSNVEHFAKGGVKTLSLGTYDGTASMAAAANHTVTHTASADVVVIDFEKETCKITSSTSQEKGLALTTVSVEAYIPKMDNTRFESIQAMTGQAMYANAELWDGTSWILGWDDILGSAGTTDFAFFLESAESDSGAGLSEQNGITLKLSGVQGELPREVA